MQVAYSIYEESFSADGTPLRAEPFLFEEGTSSLRSLLLRAYHFYGVRVNADGALRTLYPTEELDFLYVGVTRLYTLRLTVDRPLFLSRVRRMLNSL